MLETAEESKGDYYTEKRGEGVNRYVYYVTDSLLEDWVQLPDLKPEHLVVAKMIKHVCTGNLNASIDSNPPFPGKERHFLRAQIARISHGTVIGPKGMLEIDEETQKEKYTEEFTVPGTDELKSLETWGHSNPIILGVGRCTHIAPQGKTDEEKDEYLTLIGEKDPVVDRYRALNEDAPMTGLEFSWTTKIVGDAQQYN